MELNRISLRGASLGRVPFPRLSLEGRTGGEPAQDFEGYPLAIDINSARSTRSYTIYGNTDENAQGVGREMRQEIVDNLAPVTSRGYTFSIQNGIVKVSGERTQSGEIVNKCGEVKGGHKYLFFSTDFNMSGDTFCLQLFAAGHDAVYLNGREGVFTPAFDMFVYLQVDKNNQWRRFFISTNAPRLFDLTLAGWEDINTAAELVARIGLKQEHNLWENFPYGSSFVAPIRVGSRNLWDNPATERLSVNGTETASTFRNVKRITITKSGVYYIGGTSPAGDPLFFKKVSNGVYGGATSLGHTLTISSGDELWIYSAQNAINAATDICVNLSDEHNGEYSPYFAPTLYPSVLSSPLHKIGDIVDYKESNGKEWHGLIEIDGKDLDWAVYDAPKNEFRTYLAFDWANGAGVSSLYSKTVNAFFDMPDKTFRGTVGNPKILVIRDTAYATAAEFAAAMAGVKFVLQLDTPTEVQGEPLPRLAIPKGESIVTLDTAVEPSNITAKV